jgi:hypothetical protein
LRASAVSSADCSHADTAPLLACLWLAVKLVDEQTSVQGASAFCGAAYRSYLVSLSDARARGDEAAIDDVQAVGTGPWDGSQDGGRSVLALRKIETGVCAALDWRFHSILNKAEAEAAF